MIVRRRARIGAHGTELECNYGPKVRRQSQRSLLGYMEANEPCFAKRYFQVRVVMRCLRGTND
jgi:hypothetical protein